MSAPAHTPGPHATREGKATHTLAVMVSSKGFDSDAEKLAQETADANLMAAAPELLKALVAMHKLLKAAQTCVSNYLPPDSGIAEHDAFNSVIGVLDGPDQRSAEALCEEAFGKIEPTRYAKYSGSIPA